MPPRIPRASRWLAGPLARLRQRARRLRHAGTARSCPVCGASVRAFTASGRPSRPEACCPICGALERHRLVWLYFQQRTDLFDPSRRHRRVLHVAPEPCLEPRLRGVLGSSYVTADLVKPAMLKLDITAIDQPDASFDVIYCSHVLEHVSDDQQAMRELRRVLKPDGWAILLVPIISDRSHEDPTITDPSERQRLYGRYNHVRAYGPDYADRLRECGFRVSVTAPAELVREGDLVRYGLTAAAGIIHHCKRVE